MVPRNGSTVTLTCSARGAPRPLKYRFLNVKGSSQTTLRDSLSQVYTISMIDYKNFYGYKAVFACVAYNSFGSGSSRNVTLDIQGMFFFTLLQWIVLSKLRVSYSFPEKKNKYIILSLLVSLHEY